jgi:hypothetical protein
MRTLFGSRAKKLFSYCPGSTRDYFGILLCPSIFADPPATDMYYKKPVGPNAKPQFGCKRVGFRQEGFHTHFQAILSNYNNSAELAWAVAATWLNRWNTRMRRFNCGEPDHGTYDLELQYEIGNRMQALGLEPAYRDVQFTTEETSKRFGIQCTPAGFKEAARLFEEGELAPSRLPEVDDFNSPGSFKTPC